MHRVTCSGISVGILFDNGFIPQKGESGRALAASLVYSAALHVAVCLLIRPLPFLFRYQTRSKSANLETVMV